MPKDPLRKLTMVEFQDLICDEARRFVVYQVKQKFLGRPHLDPTLMSLQEWLEHFREFILEEPLGS
jgi:hypothetical protein